METYEFYEQDHIVPGNTALVYRCYRGKCSGRTVLVADRNTHNNYHNHVDNGLPSPYSEGQLCC